MAYEVVVAGHVTLDIIPKLVGGALFMPGRAIEAGPATFATGGAVANTGLALHRLGVPTRLIGKIGADMFGQAVRSLVEAHGPGLAEGLVVAPGESTAYTIILSPPGADRIFIHNPGCNTTFGAGDVPGAALAQARLFHFGYPPIMRRMYQDGGAELVALFRRAKQHGATTALDMTMTDPDGPTGRADWRAILNALLPYVDVFLPSVEEMLQMLHRPVFDQLGGRAGAAGMIEHVPAALIAELAGELLAMGSAIVGLKAGHRGLYLHTAGAAALGRMGRAAPADPTAWAGRELWAPCFEVQVVGTTGSGDATIAGFLMGLLRGMPPEPTLTAACAVGACNVEAADAFSGVRSWPATEARIAAGWPRLPLQVDAPGWSWDAARELWVGPGDRQHVL